MICILLLFSWLETSSVGTARAHEFEDFVRFSFLHDLKRKLYLKAGSFEKKANSSLMKQIKQELLFTLFSHFAIST